MSRKTRGQPDDLSVTKPMPGPARAGFWRDFERRPVYHTPDCRCGHKKTIHAGADATGRCVLRRCRCVRYEQAPVPGQPASDPLADITATKELEREPRPAPAVTVERLAAALADKRFPVIVGNGTELRTPARPHDLAVQLLSAIDLRLTDDPKPEPRPASGLAAENAELRAILTRWRAAFGVPDQNGVCRADVTISTLNRWAGDAKLPQAATSAGLRNLILTAAQWQEREADGYTAMADRAEAQDPEMARQEREVARVLRKAAGEFRGIARAGTAPSCGHDITRLAFIAREAEGKLGLIEQAAADAARSTIGRTVGADWILEIIRGDAPPAPKPEPGTVGR